jgi:hypothetical protein
VAAHRVDLGKTTFPDVSQADAVRIGAAISADRYWFSVPYAAPHGLKDRAVGFTTASRKRDHNWCLLLLTNRAYAQALVALNQLEGSRWLTGKHLLWRALGLVLAILGLGLLVGYWFGNSTADVVNSLPPITVVVAVLALVGGVVLYVLGQRGEPL